MEWRKIRQIKNVNKTRNYKHSKSLQLIYDLSEWNVNTS